MEKKAALVSVLIYTGFSLGLALIFILLTGGYPPVARIGGAIWVFILTMIITMPVVIPFIKKKYSV